MKAYVLSKYSGGNPSECVIVADSSEQVAEYFEGTCERIGGREMVVFRENNLTRIDLAGALELWDEEELWSDEVGDPDDWRQYRKGEFHFAFLEGMVPGFFITAKLPVDFATAR